jgi:hypothetical protein
MRRRAAVRPPSSWRRLAGRGRWSCLVEALERHGIALRPREPTGPLSQLKVDGVPFLIVRGYDVAGLVKSVESYLDYPEADGEWSHVQYVTETMREKRAALRELLSSPKWKTHSDAHERQRFFSQQIQ